MADEFSGDANEDVSDEDVSYEDVCDISDTDECCEYEWDSDVLDTDISDSDVLEDVPYEGESDESVSGEDTSSENASDKNSSDKMYADSQSVAENSEQTARTKTPPTKADKNSSRNMSNESGNTSNRTDLVNKAAGILPIEEDSLEEMFEYARRMAKNEERALATPPRSTLLDNEIIEGLNEALKDELNDDPDDNRIVLDGTRTDSQGAEVGKSSTAPASNTLNSRQNVYFTREEIDKIMQNFLYGDPNENSESSVANNFEAYINEFEFIEESNGAPRNERRGNPDEKRNGSSRMRMNPRNAEVGGNSTQAPKPSSFHNPEPPSSHSDVIRMSIKRSRIGIPK